MSRPIEHHYATLNGFRAHYASCGNPDNPLLLCLHGFPESWMAWRGVMPALAEQYYVVAPDTRGINESEGPGEVAGYTTGHLACDVEALLDHLGARDCVLAGHDWGGAIACAFAVAYPERLRGLVIVNSTHPGVFVRELIGNSAQRAASAYISTFLRDDAEAMLRANDFAALRAGMGQDLRTGTSPTWFDAPMQAEYQRSWSKPGSLRAGLSYYRGTQWQPEPGAVDKELVQRRYVDDAGKPIHVPTLAIWGEQDRFLLDGCVEGLHRFIPDLRIERIPEGSHWVIHEHGPRVAQRMSHFIDGIPPLAP